MGCINTHHIQKPKALPSPLCYGNSMGNHLPNHLLNRASIKLSQRSHNNSSDNLNLNKKKVIQGNNESKAKIMFAVDSYKGQEQNELSFCKGEKLTIVKNDDPDWWLAKRIDGTEQGYVPVNLLVANQLETEPWFYGKISRREAEKLLVFSNGPRGTFLIRNCEESLDFYSLSIIDNDESKGKHIKHYKIRRHLDGGYFISPRQMFDSLNHLVESYSDIPNGLCCRLTEPCQKSTPGVGPGSRSDEIDRRDLKFIRELGGGNFGKVYHGVFKGRAHVAIKTLKQGSMSPQAFLQEAAIMRRCRHEKLVPLYGVCTKGPNLLIVTEYMSNGCLLDYLRENPEGQACNIIDLIDVAAQIAYGMEYLESQKMVHRDLAARNILVGENRIVKIADFGLARIIEEEEYIAKQGAKFPIKWTAPEAIMFNKFTSKSDVWSYGILLYELVTHGQIPYAGMSNREVLVQISRGYRLPKPNCDCPNTMYDVMCKCWEQDPDNRPTFEYLHNYFDDFFICNEPKYKTAEEMIEDGDETAV